MAGTPGSTPELARLGAVHRTIPTTFTDVAVTTAHGTTSLAAFAGQWIYLRAVGDLEVLRRSASFAAGEGYPILAAGPIEEFYVDPNGVMTLGHRAGSATTLRIFHAANA